MLVIVIVILRNEAAGNNKGQVVGNSNTAIQKRHYSDDRGELVYRYHDDDGWSEEELVDYVELNKRNTWWTKTAGSVSLTLAVATAGAVAYAPAFFLGGIGAIILGLLLAITFVTGQYSIWGSLSYKRSMSHVYSGQYMGADATCNHMYYYNVTHNLGNGIHNVLSNNGLHNYTAFTINSTSGSLPGLVHMNSTLGSHLMKTFNGYTITDLVNDIVQQHSSNCTGECHLEKMYGNKTVRNVKRSTPFQINWSSYNYDLWLTSNFGNEVGGPDFDGNALENDVNDGYSDVGYPDTWKYCLCVSDDPGQDYDDIGDFMGSAGEVYFNTYGGVDGYCNDFHCGAQCSLCSFQNKRDTVFSYDK